MSANRFWFGPLRVWMLVLSAGLFGALVVHVIPTAVAVVGDESNKGDATRQVTVFAIQAVRGEKTTDARLDGLKARLAKLKPGHGFTLLDVRSRPILAGESAVVKDLANGCEIKTTLTQSVDENGKFEIRCEMSQGKGKPTSTRVKAPLNQLFFLDYPLPDGTTLLVGVGAR